MPAVFSILGVAWIYISHPHNFHEMLSIFLNKNMKHLSDSFDAITHQSYTVAQMKLKKAGTTQLARAFI